MALLILDEKSLGLHRENFSLSSLQMQQAIIWDQWRHLQLIQPHCCIGEYLIILGEIVACFTITTCKKFRDRPLIVSLVCN